MSVYVDSYRVRAVAYRVDAHWSHLVADETAELAAFIDRLGMDERRIQHRGSPKEHVDVTDAERERCIAAGAHPIDKRQLVAVVRAKRR